MKNNLLLSDRQRRLSYSRISSFSKCNRIDWFKYRLGFPSKPTFYTDRGTLIHDLIEHLISPEETKPFDNMQSDGECFYLKKDTLEMVDKPNDLSNVYKVPYSRYSMLSKDDVKNIVCDEFVQVKSNSMVKDLSELQEVEDEDAAGLYIERPVGKEFDNFSFIGFIDTLIIEDNVAKIIDYKSGKVRPDYNQLKLYALFLSYQYPELDKFELNLYYTSYDTLKQMTIYKKDLEKIEAKLFSDADKILNDSKGTACRGFLCDWCDYKEYCSGLDKYLEIMDDFKEISKFIPDEVELRPITYGSFEAKNIIVLHLKDNQELPLMTDYLTKICEECNFKFDETFFINTNIFNGLNEQQQEMVDSMISDNMKRLCDFVCAKNIVFTDEISKKIITGTDFMNKTAITTNNLKIIDYDINSFNIKEPQVEIPNF